MKDKSIGRKEQQKILEEMTAEQKLDSLENERKNVLELDPELGMRIFIEVKELIALLSNNNMGTSNDPNLGLLEVPIFHLFS